MNGVLPVFKPRGMSSYDVIRAVQEQCKFSKNLKMGHAGTLDPLAEGVLVLLVGEATKLFEFLLDHEKVYEVTVQFGVSMTTDDAEGEVVFTSSLFPSFDEVKKIVMQFTGKILQVPPRYSALKVDGKRAYERARRGEDFSLQPREVEIFSHEVMSYDEAKRVLVSRVCCSSGTYIRSLARDMGEALGCYGYVSRLVRLETLGITVGECVPLERLGESNWQNFLLPVSRVLHYPILGVKNPEWVMHGRILERNAFLEPPQNDGFYQIREGERLLAVGEWKGERFFYRRVFHA